MDANQRLVDLIAPVLEQEHVELVDLEHPGGVVRVIVDRDGGIDLDLIAELTRRISRLLDEHDPVRGRYTLEVSSPGLERPLRTPAHFRRAVGQQVTVRVQAEVEADRRIDGPLESADDDGIVVAGRRFAYDEIERARTVFEWGPAPRPGGPGRQTRTRKTKHERSEAS